jgi:hypothetical protein
MEVTKVYSYDPTYSKQRYKCVPWFGSDLEIFMSPWPIHGTWACRFSLSPELIPSPLHTSGPPIIKQITDLG